MLKASNTTWIKFWGGERYTTPRQVCDEEATLTHPFTLLHLFYLWGSPVIEIWHV